MEQGVTAQRRVLVYGLIDPRNGHLRYVGKTVQAAYRRFAEHLCHHKRQRTKCSSWITSLDRAGLRPEMVELEHSNSEQWRDAEKFWIASFRLMGADLCNLAEGGAGRDGYRLSDEHKSKIAASSAGRICTEQTRQKLRLAKLGKARPDVALRNSEGAKLSDSQVAAIKESSKTGIALANEHGVSTALISLIRSGKRRALSSQQEPRRVS